MDSESSFVISFHWLTLNREYYMAKFDLRDSAVLPWGHPPSVDIILNPAFYSIKIYKKFSHRAHRDHKVFNHRLHRLTQILLTAKVSREGVLVTALSRPGVQGL